MPSENALTCALYVEKGGVGKTTSAAHLGVAAASEHDLDVLLIDLAGTQNDLATQFGLSEDIDDPDAPVSAVFGDDWNLIREGIPDVVDRMVFSTDEGVDLIPADAGLGAADNNLANVPLEERYDRLDEFLTEDLAPLYDLIILDLPGKEDNISLNGLYAAEDTIAPLRPGEFERTQLKKLDQTLAELTTDFSGASPQLSLVFPTMVDQTTLLSERFTNELEGDYPDIVGNAVAETANIGTGQAEGRTLFAYPDDELYDTGRRARNAYQENTTKLLTQFQS